MDKAGEHERMIVTEMRRDLQSVYVTPSGTREAGYINFEHFGRRISYLNPVFDLTLIPSCGCVTWSGITWPPSCARRTARAGATPST